MSTVRKLIEQRPKERVVAKPKGRAVEELTLVNGISNPPSMEPHFAEFKASGESNDLRVLKFECNWMEKRKHSLFELRCNELGSNKVVLPGQTAFALGETELAVLVIKTEVGAIGFFGDDPIWFFELLVVFLRES